MIVVYQLFLRGQTPSWDYSVADRSRRKLIVRSPFTALHFTFRQREGSCRRWKVLRFSRRIDLAGFNVNVDRLRNRASLTSGWVMPINFTCDKPSQNRQKARQLTLARADYSFFISAPVLTPLILFLYLLSLGHPAFVSLLPR